MFKKICITNRSLCQGDFLDRMSQVVESHPDRIILREKDMTPEAYGDLARKLLPICQAGGVELFAHSFVDQAQELGIRKIHLPLGILEKTSPDKLDFFTEYGASIHSLEDLERAENMGVTYVIAGHIFLTDCKKGLPARGLNFLHKVCQKAKVPVYAIGGMREDRLEEVAQAGANGACFMSSYMTGEF